MTSRFLLVYLALFVPFAVITPYLQKLLFLRGFHEDQIGLIQGCFEAMAVLAPPLWGYLSDHSGRPRLILALCMCGAIPAFQVFGLVHGLTAALGAAALFGFFYRPLIPLTDGITFRYINTHGGDYGKVRVGGSLAFVGCLLLLEPLGIGSSRDGRMILVAVAIAGVFHLASLALIPAAGTAPASARPADTAPHQSLASTCRELCRPQFLWFTLCAFLGRLALMSYYGFFTLYLAKEHGIEKAGLIWLLGPLSEIPVIYYSRRIMDRIGVRNLFALGLLGITVRLASFCLAPSLWFVVPLQLLHSLTFGAYHCSSVTYVSRIVPVRLQSTAQTLFAAVTVGLGSMIGGAVGGMVARHFGFRTLYGSFSVLAAVSLALLLLTVPRADGGRAKPPQRG
jgi:PPP family 3-phenylpropionic acid transporter